jgi:hypothetical protein
MSRTTEIRLLIALLYDRGQTSCNLWLHITKVIALVILVFQ